MTANATNVTDIRCLTNANDDDIYIVYVIVKFLVGVVITTLNAVIISLLCLCYWKRRRLLYIPSNRLLLSLLICEFLTGLTVVISAICNVYPVCRYSCTPTTLGFRISMDIIESFIVKSVVMHLCGLTIDRYMSVFYALKYHTYVTKKTVKYYIILSWSLPFCVSIIQWSWLHQALPALPTDIDNLSQINNIEVWYSLVSFIVFLAIPMCLISAALLTMFIEIRRLVRCVPKHHVDEMTSKQRRFVCVLCLMYTTFLLLAMPYFTLRLLIDIGYWMGERFFRLDENWIHFAIIVRYMTSLLNPLIYARSSPELRTLVIRLAGKLYDDISMETFTRRTNGTIERWRSSLRNSFKSSSIRERRAQEEEGNREQVILMRVLTSVV